MSSLCFLQHIDYYHHFHAITSIYKPCTTNLFRKQSIKNSVFNKKPSLFDQSFSKRDPEKGLLYQNLIFFLQSSLVRIKNYDRTSQLFLFSLCFKNEDITTTQKNAITSLISISCWENFLKDNILFIHSLPFFFFFQMQEKHSLA